MAEQQAARLEIRVFRDNRKAVRSGVFPDFGIRRVSHPEFADVCALRENIGQQPWQSRRKILVKQEFHAGKVANLRSRSAANARQARMSSSVRSGNSATISSGVIPPARYSNTSVTAIRKPLMHGLPPRLSGSIVMIFV